MKDVVFYNTKDGSVGMYDKETKDIYHSVTGALRESYDKFIMPTQFESFCRENQKVNILDICFGIGYNTKSAIYYAIKNNQSIKINIDALELNKTTSFIAPFIKDGLKSPDINLFILSVLLLSFPQCRKDIIEFLKCEQNIVVEFFDQSIVCLFLDFLKKDSNNYHSDDLFAFLHNIYYQNISTSMESDLKPNNILKCILNIKFGDARQTVNSLTDNYDFIFLDAFTPHKQPLLWTKEFLSIVTSKLNPSGVISTYSNSTPVRKTLLDLGLFVGKIILNEKQFGTVASRDKTKIINPLNKYDLGLTNTKSGIPYKDNIFLNLSSKEILLNRENELKACDKMSTTEYKKRFINEV